MNSDPGAERRATRVVVRGRVQGGVVPGHHAATGA